MNMIIRSVGIVLFAIIIITTITAAASIVLENGIIRM